VGGKTTTKIHKTKVQENASLHNTSCESPEVINGEDPNLKELNLSMPSKE